MRKSVLSDRKILTTAVISSKNIKEVLSKLNIKGAGNYKTFQKYINLFSIDISHFTKNIGNGGNKYNIDDIISGEITYKNSSNLKERLYKEGLKQRKCELCEQDENWKIGKISLILDHIDGNHNNNVLTNLRIICPNCDSTLPTYKGRNHKNKGILKYIPKNKQTDSKITIDIIQNIINNKEIDFSKTGRIQKLSKKINLSPSRTSRILKKYFPNIYYQMV